MAAKCPVCGAPMENGRCDYCGYVERVANEPPVREANSYNQASQPQLNQQQVVINNTIVNNVGPNKSAVPMSAGKANGQLSFCAFFWESLEYIGFMLEKSVQVFYICLQEAFS